MKIDSPYRRFASILVGSALSLLIGKSRGEAVFREIDRMCVGRNSHTATVLADGRLLVTGGKDARHKAIASAEIYDPETGTFTPAKALIHGRYGHHATLLPDQRVLITGGGADAEIFTSANGSWSVTQPADGQPGGDSATLLTNGLVLVIGGVGDAPSGVARLYDPVAHKWTRTGSLSMARRNLTATRLADGRVLVCGGSDYQTGSVTRSAELYNPSTGTWSNATSLTVSRHRHTATLLADGRVLVCGGNNRDAVTSSEIFDPATGFWTTVNPLSIQRENHTAVLLPDDRVLVCGGVATETTVLASSEIFDPALGSWTAGDDLASSRCLHAATQLKNGDVLITGGWGAYGRPLPSDFNLAMHDAEIFGIPAPEIALLQGGAAITTGETIGFGTVPIGGESIRRFTLRNSGSATLSNLNFTIDGPYAAAFVSNPSGFPTTLAAKSEFSFILRFSPLSTGNSAARLIISSNDNNEGEFTLYLTGSAVTPSFPEIAIEHPARKNLADGRSSVDFGGVTLRSGRTLNFIIRNKGPANLTGIFFRKVGANSNDFTVVKLPSSTLPSGGKTVFSVTFSPSAKGQRTASLLVYSNDSNESPFDIFLTGNGRRR